MLKILKFGKQYWYVMLLTLFLLFVQSNCDLALPEYTSNIVDVGIQSGGIESPVPSKLRAITYDKLALFMTEEELAIMEEAYEKSGSESGEETNQEMNESSNVKLDEENGQEVNESSDAKPDDENNHEMNENSDAKSNEEADVASEDGIYILKEEYEPVLHGTTEEDFIEYLDKNLSYDSEENVDKTKEYLIKLRSLMSTKETLLVMLSAEGEEAEAMKQELLTQMNLPTETDLFDAFAMLPKEVVLKISSAIEEELAKMAETVGDSSAITFVIDEYKQMGIDVNEIQLNYLMKQGLIMLVIAFIGMLVAVLSTYTSSKMAAKVAMNLRGQVFHKVVKFSSVEMNQFSTASLITRCTNDIQQVQMVMTMMFRIVLYAPLMALGGIIRVTQTKSGMGWISVLGVACIFSIVGILMVVAMPKFKKMQVLVDKLNLVSREILTGIPVIRAFGREKYEEKRFDKASLELKNTQLFTNVTMAFMMPAMNFVMNGITVLIIWVGAKGIDLGNIQVGTLMAFITYTMHIVMSFLMITMISIMLPRAAVAAGRIEEVLNTEIVIDNKKETKSLTQNGGVKGEVSFEHVSFRYPNGEEDALTDIHFVAKPGETTAIIGSTGCGKSSLVQLIPRLFDVTEGKITIDGVDIRDLELKELRDNIGYVPQKGVLFSGTIAENIAFGQDEINQDVVKEAARIAQATEFIDAKPETYDSPIAQGGTNVSGGQKQRLAIARALAKKPQILVFDDSFSALDYRTDKALRKELLNKTKDATVIIVAQRISTILHADKIIVLDDGRIVGMGTHKELLRENEIYRQIASSQLSEKEMKEVE